MFLNRGAAPRDITATFAELGLAPSTRSVTVEDVWSGEKTSGVASSVTARAVEPHGVWFGVLTPEKK